MSQEKSIVPNFATYPRSLSAYRSDKSDAACDWTARDVLIETLRMIDSGEVNPDHMVVVFRDILPEGVRQTGYCSSGEDSYVMLGMMHLSLDWLSKTFPVATAFVVLAPWQMLETAAELLA